MNYIHSSQTLDILSVQSEQNSVSSSRNTQSGECRICGAFVKLTGSTGVIHKHGHGGGRPSCPGSGQRPSVPGTSLDIDNFDDDSQSQGNISETFSITFPLRTTLRRIPRGARSKAAQAFENRLRALLTSPTVRRLFLSTVEGR